MLALLHMLLGAAGGFAAGWFLRSVAGMEWLADAPLTGVACGCTGQACRTALAWVSRPSEATRSYQDRIATPAVVISLALAMAAVLTLLRFPATIVVPAASYLLVRVLLSWQERATGGTLSPVSLQIAARGGEILTLAASAVAAREPLS